MDEKKKVSYIKERLAQGPTAAELALWSEDPRMGVQHLLASYEKKQIKKRKEQQRLQQLQSMEQQYWDRGLEYVAGCDEAGRGPLAGPLVTAAVILPHTIWLPGLNDSKKVSAKRREELYGEILDQAVAVTVSILGPREIDTLNIYQAAKQAMTLCLTHMKVRPLAAITDAMPLNLPDLPVQDVVRGDSRSAAVAAASIIAKVTRDRIMEQLDLEYPQYGFATHKGYGTAKHMHAVLDCGPTPWHRRSYEPLKSMGDTGEAISENRLLQLK